MKSADFSCAQINHLIDEIILELQNFKKINEEHTLKDSKTFAFQNELFKSILSIIQRDINKNDLHLNKKFLISTALNDIKSSKDQQFISEEFKIDETRISEFQKIKEIVENLKEMKFDFNG